ncbi:MAG TPA: c-type cytochrome [Kofleriaceae bacterium]|nr:c-type cytochrome [Kofleriaceae bacterium]
MVSSIGCGGGGDDAKVTGYQIVAEQGSSLTAVAGDAVQLKVVETLDDGNTRDVPGDTKVTWTAPPTITSLAPDDTTSASPMPAPGADPTGFFLNNPTRGDAAADLRGTLFVLDAGASGAGSIAVSATVPGQAAPITASVVVGPTPAGDATKGKTTYRNNCAICHGQTGDGSPPNPDGSYTIDGLKSDFPAPGLNNAPGAGFVGGDPDWNAAVLAVAARADADDGAVALRLPMPSWLTEPSIEHGKPLTTQDFADIYAYLVSETQ